MNIENSKQQIKELVEKYDKIAVERGISRYNEEMTKKDFILPLFKALGWDTENSNEVTAEETISKKRVDYSFRINNIPKFFLEAKSLREDLSNPEFVKQAVNYAWHKGCTWAVLTNFKEIYVFNSEVKSLNPLQITLFSMNCNEFPDKFNQLYLLSREGFEQGTIDKEAEKWGKKTKKISVDKQLLADFTIFRELLSKNVMKLNTSRNLTESDLDESVQRILDRLIFIRNCEDRELEPKILISNFREWESRGRGQLIKNLRQTFKEFDQKYNSKLFQEHLCDSLDIDNEILSEIISGLYHTKDMAVSYDFSAIEADVLGNIYEQYLGHILRKTDKRAKLTESHAHRKEQGIYYTPTYIVDYIVRNTLGELLKEKGIDASKIRVLDPACGSGSFLIRAFDVLKEYHRQKADKYTQVNYDEILKNNIFGVDLDKQAVEIAQLNLLLKIAEKGHKLPLLEQNIKCGNSLIDDESVAGDKAFRWEKEFSEIMKDGGFDVVIGNPPYLLMQPQNTPLQLLNYIKNNFKVAQYKIDTYHLFLERAISLLKEGGYFGFITPNTYLMNIYISNLRKFILDNCKVLKIVIIPQEVFPDASVDTAITILQKETNEIKRKNNKIEVLEISDFFHDVIKSTIIQQNNFLIAKDYMFNIKTFGKGTDIIKKLSNNSLLLGSISRISFGLQTKDKKTYVKNTSVNDKWKPCINGRDITRYNLKFGSQYFLHDISIKAGGCWDENTHNVPEKIVIRQIGVTPIATLDNNKYYCLNTIYNVTSLNDKYNYRYVLSIINSKLIKFFWKTLFYDSKLLFPKIKKAYLDQLPIKTIIESQQQPLITLVDRMLSLNKRLNELGDKKTDERAKIEEEIKKTDAEIDELVYNIYGITKEEKRIIGGNVYENMFLQNQN